jgi:hypothetical protein
MYCSTDFKKIRLARVIKGEKDNDDPTQNHKTNSVNSKFSKAFASHLMLLIFFLKVWLVSFTCYLKKNFLITY